MLYDFLIYLLNWCYFIYIIEYYFENVKCFYSEGNFVLLNIDIDCFKFINDFYGYSVGDKVLVVCVERIKLSLWVFDLVVWIGGDEFFVLIL